MLSRQVYFPFVPEHGQKRRRYYNSDANKLFEQDRAFHQWYRFVLSFPPHLVQEYIGKFQLCKEDVLLDPFCGTGTTLVEAKKHGLQSIGVEANKAAHFASTVKCDWTIDINNFVAESEQIAKLADKKIQSCKKIRILPDEQMELLLECSISPIPLHKTLILLEIINETQQTQFTKHQRLALAASTVRDASNLHFGPEVGVTRIKKQDSDVVANWLATINMFARDLKEISTQKKKTRPEVILGDARCLEDCLQNYEYHSVAAVFTSPPYPNEKDYTRTTRLESVLLGFLHNKSELREMKQGLLRSNSRNIYKNDNDDHFINNHSEVIKLAETIESKRIAMGKTSGFEKMYHKVVLQYFGGMTRHLESLKPFLRKGAMLGYVVGDQASFLQVYIPTGKILADIAVNLGYKLVSIDPFRTRFATATKMKMNEEIVVLQWIP
ncbi:MAG: site-specific DNA-methyltransferase [Planctomycetaceae bacterium]|nr:site-specific DNA-methyltransferase [Planctomycetaceae bacterium]